MIEHENGCPEKGDLRCDCDYEARVRAEERREVILDGEAGIIYHDLEAEWRADERERIARKWQTRDWPIITAKVGEREVIAVAQIVTDWLRAQGEDND